MVHRRRLRRRKLLRAPSLFLGGAAGDPYEALKRALKADIDEEAWASLNTTLSRPFARPAKGKICVKIINHFSDEVQKVFGV